MYYNESAQMAWGKGKNSFYFLIKLNFSFLFPPSIDISNLDMHGLGWWFQSFSE